jgi:predicted RecB family nuclease
MKITSSLFLAHIKCPTKCWLRFTGEPATGNPYAEWVQSRNESYRESEIERLRSEVPQDECATMPGQENLKTSKWRLGFNVFVATSQNLETHLQAVERVRPEGRGKTARFIPISFMFANKLGKDEKLLLAFDALLLSEILGREITLGKIVHGDSHAPLTVKTTTLVGEVQKRLDKIVALLSNPTPPDLVLNRHCVECEFQARCRQKAIEKDDLSLLSSMGENERKKLRAKGIFTVTQLSYTFRPRRRPKRLRDKREKYHHSLRALAIREQKIHLVGRPELKVEGTPVYLDVEGLPDRDFYYLIGVRIGNGESAVQHSLWADTLEDEGRIWREFLGILETVEKPVLIHYGSYESTFLKRMCERYETPQKNSGVFKTITLTINVISILYAQIYFPTFSNSLKEVTRFLGIEDSPEIANGLATIPKREKWEKDRNSEFKAQLLSYNATDCLRLCRICEFINCATVAEQGTPVSCPTSPNNIVQTDDIPRIRERWEMFSSTPFVLADFKFINKCAYFDYQRHKVFVRTARQFKKINKQHFELKPANYRANATVRFEALQCPTCGQTPKIPPKESSHLLLDVKFFSGGVKRWVTRFKWENSWCPKCGKRFCHPDRPSHRVKYGYTLICWGVYLATYCGFNMNRTRKFIADVFGLSLPDCQYFVFKRVLSAKYEHLYKEILASLLTHRALHIDETSVNLKGQTGYVWVLAGMDRVYYFYRPTREASFLGEMLMPFTGTLISDFYSGYESLSCSQQKCIIHFIRDINEDLLKNPFDLELRLIAERFGSLLRTIIETVDRYGLKQRHLGKHKKQAGQFLDWAESQQFSSDPANNYKRRLGKIGPRMFTFLEHDGVPWNNNNAEHAIKRFAKYRRETGGRFTEGSLKDYLILATVFETCEFNNVSVLRFLLSQETTLSGLLRMAGRKTEEATPLSAPQFI